MEKSVHAHYILFLTGYVIASIMVILFVIYRNKAKHAYSRIGHVCRHNQTQ